MLDMKPFGKRKSIVATLESLPDVVQDAVQSALPRRRGAKQQVLATVGWVSAGLGAVALGLFVGRELRQRYKFNRRTPYDVYAHAGDNNAQDVEFGVGI